MLIKHKLIANTVLLITSLLVMVILVSYSTSSLKNDINITQAIGELDAGVLLLRRNEKDFLARNDEKYLDKFNQNYQEIQQTRQTLLIAYRQAGFDSSQLETFGQIVTQYHTLFTRLADAKKTIGLTPTSGLYGQLRQAVHNVESLIGEQDYEILSGMLQLRRNEKDFMLRLDPKYVDKLNTNYQQLVNTIKQKSSIDNKDRILEKLEKYQQAFNQLVQQQTLIGLTAEDGILGEMREIIHQVDNVLTALIKNNKQQVNDYANQVTTTAYIIFVLLLIISVTTAMWIAKSINTGVTQLRESMEHIAKTNDLSVTVTLKNQDELGQMATAFNKMIASFRHLIEQVNDSVATLNEATFQLTENIHTANEGVDKQLQESDMVATAVTEMVSTVEEIANNTNEAAHKAEATNANAQLGMQGVDSTMSQIEQLSSTLLASESIVQDLAKDSETIGSVLDVIRSIAEQTNLLALNAAIEAARAGEQGRGFAVVADEVRTLASRTQESTKEIESIIHALQRRTSDVVKQMSLCRTQGDESANQAAMAGKMLKEITQDVATIVDMNSAIAVAIKEQTMVAGEVNEHVVAIRDIADLSRQVAIRNAQMSEELAQQAETLKQEISRYIV
jgi:methyl-accepting chemotaxis protein